MQNNEKCKVLSAESKPYDFQGNKGVSHKIRVLIEGEIFSVKTTAEQVTEFKQYVGKDGEAVVQFVSPKENLKMNLISFKVK